MPRPKQRTPDLRDHVVQVAVGMLAADGVAGFTTRKVAEQARTSTPAVYELFGDKAGLVREVFFEGFRLLGDAFAQVPDTDDPQADVVALFAAFRTFASANPELAQVMFSRPFADFDPIPDETAAGAVTRKAVTRRVRRCVEAGVLHGDVTDISHVLFSLAQGLAAAETTKRLGTTKASIDRRWRLAVEAVLAGLG